MNAENFHIENLSLGTLGFVQHMSESKDNCNQDPDVLKVIQSGLLSSPNDEEDEEDYKYTRWDLALKTAFQMP